MLLPQATLPARPRPLGDVGAVGLPELDFGPNVVQDASCRTLDRVLLPPVSFVQTDYMPLSYCISLVGLMAQYVRSFKCIEGFLHVLSFVATPHCPNTEEDWTTEYEIMVMKLSAERVTGSSYSIVEKKKFYKYCQSLRPFLSPLELPRLYLAAKDFHDWLGCMCLIINRKTHSLLSVPSFCVPLFALLACLLGVVMDLRI